MWNKPIRGSLLNKAHPLAKGLVGCWLFNEGSGLKTFDLTGNRNHGTFGTGVTAPTWKPGRTGVALDFDGDNDFVDCGHSTSLNITDAITIEARIYPEGWGEGNYGRIVDKIYTTGYVFTLANPSSEESLRFLSYDAGIDQWAGANVISLNTWQHVAVTYDKQHVKFFINGKYTNGGIETASLGVNSDDLLIGNSEVTDRGFDGTIDEVRIYNRALSADEIKHLYYDPYCIFASVDDIASLYIALGQEYTESVIIELQSKYNHLSIVEYELLKILQTLDKKKL